MKKNYAARSIIIAVILIFSAAESKSQYLVSSEPIDVVTPGIFILFGFPGEFSVSSYKVTYNTIDTQGEPTVASGLISFPLNSGCTELPMIEYCHGTVLRQFDVPSENNLEATVTKAFASTGFIGIAPDYIGLGVNPGVHPYVHAESQATASIDLIYAAREFLDTMDDLSDNGELFITGYSQGGHAAMATLKYAQDNDLVEDLGIVAGAPGSGPYNLSESQATVILSDEPYSNPGYIVYLLIGYQLAYGNLYEDLGDIIQSPYDTLVLPYFDGAQNSYNMGVVNAMLPNQVSDLLVDSVLINLANNENHPIWEALRDNDNFDWTPEMPLRLFYCDGDEQVAYTNSIITAQTMQANGASDVEAVHALPGASHGECILPALTGAHAYFTSLATFCNTLSASDEKPVYKALRLAPNPAKDQVRISLNSPEGELTVFDLFGRQILRQRITSTETNLNVAFCPAGIYLVVAETPEGVEMSRLVVE